MRRRTFCTALSAGTITAFTATGTAHTGTQRPVVTTVGHFDSDWGGPHRVEEIGPLEYETNGEIPGLDTTMATDVTIFVPGFRPGADSRSQDGEGVGGVFAGLRAQGYDGGVIRYAWDSATNLWNWEEKTAIANWNGAKLAAFTRDLLAVSPQMSVRYIGHSLGASIVVSALQTLADWDHSRSVSSVSLLGASVPRTKLAEGGTYTAAVGSQALRVDNYWSPKDEVLGWASPETEDRALLGVRGLDWSGPETYADHRVEIDDHFAYLDSDTVMTMHSPDPGTTW